MKSKLTDNEASFFLTVSTKRGVDRSRSHLLDQVFCAHRVERSVSSAGLFCFFFRLLEFCVPLDHHLLQRVELIHRVLELFRSSNDLRQRVQTEKKTFNPLPVTVLKKSTKPESGSLNKKAKHYHINIKLSRHPDSGFLNSPVE